eukprot:93979_1
MAAHNNDEEWMSHFATWFNTAYPHFSLRRKEDKPPFVCYHQLKDIPMALFWEKCCNICFMAHVEKPLNAPKDIDNLGLCMECAVHMFINTNHCSLFEKFIEYDPTKKKTVHCLHFSGTAQCIRIFLYIVGIPSIFNRIISEKTSFVRFIKLMIKSDIFTRDWIKFVESIGKNITDNTFQVALERDQDIKETMTLLFHRTSSLHHEWIASLLNDNDPFLQSSLFSLHNAVDPGHTCLYLSYLTYKYNKVQHHQTAQYQHYKSLYKDTTKHQYRDRIICGNKKCGIHYYDHKNAKRKWYRCKRCQIMYYCSRKCQKYDWSKFDHQTLCNKLVRV